MRLIVLSASLLLLVAGRAGAQANLIEGRILDAALAPVAGAGVLVGSPDTILTADVLDRPDARTDAGGRFALHLPPPADPDLPCERCLHVTAPGKVAMQQRIPQDGTLLGGARSRMDVGDLVLEDAVAIKGRVRTRDGKPLPHARITARDLLGNDGWVFWREGFAPQPESHTVSLADGTFQLLHVHAAGLEVHADCPGYYRQSLAAVSARDPLVLELEPSGFARGRVLDAAGKPCRSLLRVSYEASDEPQVLVTEADGSFAVPVRFRGRYRVRCVAEAESPMLGQPAGILGESRLLDGPQGVEIRLAPAAAVGSIRVRARDPDGRPVGRFTARVLWNSDDPWTLVAGREGPVEVAAGADGTALLPGPAGGSLEPGVLGVRAEGFATCVQGDLFFEKDGQEVDVRLAPEAVLAGRVVDPDTGAGIEGATVAAPGHPSSDDLFRAKATTGAGGTFRIGGLGHGRHLLVARAEGRPEGPRLQVILRPGQQATDLTLRLPSGGRVEGRLTGGTPPPAARVTSEDDDLLHNTLGALAAPWLELFAPPSRGGGIADEKGAFVLEGLASGLVSLDLLQPQPVRNGGPLRIALDRVRVRRAETVVEEFDLASAQPAVWHGRVVVVGDQVPMHRLRVVAFAGSGGCVIFFPGLDGATRRTIPDADGRFSLLLPPGTHGLRVEDLLTGVRLGQLEARKLASRQRHEGDIEIAVVRARVRFVMDGGRPLVAERLRVLIEGADGEEDAPFEFVGLHRVRGVSLSCAPPEVDVYMPPGRTRVQAVVDPGRLRHGDPTEPEVVVLGELEFGASPGAPQALALPVACPPEVPDLPD